MFTPERIDPSTWPPIFRLLEPAMQRCGSTAIELVDELVSGTAQLWVLRKGGDPVAAAVSELLPSPSGMVVHGRLLAGGHVDEAVETVTHHAREVGAVAVRIEGRRGWERRLKGWRRAAVVMELPLEAARG